MWRWLLLVGVVINLADAAADIVSVPGCEAQYSRYDWFRRNGTVDELAAEQRAYLACVADHQPKATPAPAPRPAEDFGLMAPGQLEQEAAKRAAREAEQERWRAAEAKRLERAEALRLESEKMLKQPKWTGPIISAYMCREAYLDLEARRRIRDEMELIEAGAQGDLEAIVAAKEDIRSALLEIRRLKAVMKRYKAKAGSCTNKLVLALVFCLPDDSGRFSSEADTEGCAGKGVTERVELAGYMEELQ